MMDVELRPVEDGDLETLYEHQLDEQAAAMAGFPSRGRDAFIAHWDRIRADPACLTLSIVAGGELAGNLGWFSIGLGLLPFYWYLWKNARRAEFDGVRKGLTVTLAFMCWVLFLTGHVVNNVRGFGS